MNANQRLINSPPRVASAGEEELWQLEALRVQRKEAKFYEWRQMSGATPDLRWQLAHMQNYRMQMEALDKAFDSLTYAIYQTDDVVEPHAASNDAQITSEKVQAWVRSEKRFKTSIHPDGVSEIPAIIENICGITKSLKDEKKTRGYPIYSDSNLEDGIAAEALIDLFESNQKA